MTQAKDKLKLSEQHLQDRTSQLQEVQRKFDALMKKQSEDLKKLQLESDELKENERQRSEDLQTQLITVQ